MDLGVGDVMYPGQGLVRSLRIGSAIEEMLWEMRRRWSRVRLDGTRSYRT